MPHHLRFPAKMNCWNKSPEFPSSSLPIPEAQSLHSVMGKQTAWLQSTIMAILLQPQIPDT